jgi:hypothetical protein
MANGAIRNLVRPIEPKRPGRRHRADTNTYSDTYAYFDSNAYTYNDTNPDSNADINAYSYTRLGTCGDDKSCTWINLYRFDCYLPVVCRERHPICPITR